MRTLLIILSLALIGVGVYMAVNDPKNKNRGTPTEVKEASLKNKAPEIPVAKKIPYKMTMHKDTRIDDYYWMRDDKREAPEVLAHLEAENKYKKQMLAHTEGLQKSLFDEIVSRIEKDNSSVPYKRKNYWFYTRFEEGKEYPIYARKKNSLDTKEEIMIDVNALAPKEGYFNITGLSLSDNEQILAYAEDTNGRRVYSIKFKNLKDGTLYKDTLEGASSNIVWANDDEHLFYIKKDPQTLLGYQVYRHKLGTEQASDTLMYEEKDTSFYTGIGKTLDNSLLVIGHSSTDTQGMSILDANNPNGTFEIFYPLEKKHEYSINKSGNNIYVLTNKDAQNFRLMKTTLSERNVFSQWKEVVAHDEKTLLSNVIVFNDYIALNERNNGLRRIRIMDKQTGTFTSIQANDQAYVMSFSTNVDPASKTLRYYYSSLTTPGSIYDYDIASGQSELKKQDKVLGDFDSKNYASERISIKARDGTLIPVSIVYRKDTFKKDGTNPLYQYGYGSYGATIDPRFRSTILSLIDRGFVYAIAHIRGSQTLGREWYEEGKMFNKINTFTDFIDVTDGLVSQKYAAQDKVFIAGGSAGGLLMGAVINMAPEKYRGVAAHVPFVDVVTTMLDASIPLTTNEYDEWGNPNNKDSYDYMLSYSPYDQVTVQDYPNMLVTTGLHDSQVQYFEPMKWVAKLRDYKTDDNKLLFHINMEAGHGGASGRFKRLEQVALEYAFFMDLIGIKE